MCVWYSETSTLDKFKDLKWALQTEEDILMLFGLGIMHPQKTELIYKRFLIKTLISAKSKVVCPNPDLRTQYLGIVQ